MPRVKVGTLARRRRKRTLKLAKGYFGSKHILYKTAHEQVMKSLSYAYRDRKKRKSNFRKLWISRINAAARINGMSYSRMINGLKQAGIEINRKMLADIAVNDEDGFKTLVEAAKKGLSGDLTPSDTQQAAQAKSTEKGQDDLSELTVDELKDLCRERDITGYSTMKKAELVDVLSK